MSKEFTLPAEFFVPCHHARSLLGRCGWTPAENCRIRIVGFSGRTRTAELMAGGYAVAIRTIHVAEARRLWAASAGR